MSGALPSSFSTFLPAFPEMYLAAAACALLMVEVFAGVTRRGVTAVTCLVLLAAGALLTARYGLVPQRTVMFDGLYVADDLAVLLKLVGFITVGVALLYSGDYLHQRGIRGGEYYVLALTALLGICVLASANSLLSVYLGVELLSLSLYAMVAFDRESGTAAEAAIKYFVLGAIASGTLLFGMSILYGLTGTLNLDQLAAFAGHGGWSAGFIIGVAFVVAAVAFKFGAVPFHMWVPDVYHGAPSSVSLFIAATSALSSFALAIRLLAHGMAGMAALWTLMLVAIAVVSLLLGNIVAIAQTNLRRMLAYSAIGNVGFILLGFVGARAAGYHAALFFVIAYILATLGSFGLILLLSRADTEHDTIADFKGLNARDPIMAGVMLLMMFSTAGVPPFVGFWGKLWIIQSLLNAGYVGLAIFAVLISVVGAFYYLRVVWYMYFDQGLPPAATAPRRMGMRLVLLVNGAAVLALGLLPNALMQLCVRVIQ